MENPSVGRNKAGWRNQSTKYNFKLQNTKESESGEAIFLLNI